MSKVLLLSLLALCAFAQKPNFPDPSFFHPGCTITHIFQEQCSSIVYFLDNEFSLFRPGPNGLYYYMLTNTADDSGNMYLMGNVTNPGSWFNFETLVTLSQGVDLCTVASESRSPTFTYYDAYQNYCNVFLMFRGLNSMQTTVSNCKWQPKDASICSKP